MVAQEAGRLAFEGLLVLIEVGDEQDHRSRGYLEFLIVFVPTRVVSIDHVAGIAFDTKGFVELVHHRDQLVGGQIFEHLDVLELLSGGFGFGGFLCILREGDYAE